VPSVYIAQIDCPRNVETKINSKHGVPLDEVQATFCWPSKHFSARRYVPSPEDPRGPRIAVQGRSPRGRTLQAVLYPVDEELGIWRLGTCVPMV
jgi:hypothetical protein